MTPDAEPEDPDYAHESDRGYCPTFIQICRDFREWADDQGLDRDERNVFRDLIETAGYQTGAIEGITWADTAEIIDCSRPTAMDRLRALESKGLIRFHFPRGHRGWIAVDAYLDVVRTRPSLVPEIEDHLVSLQTPPLSARQNHKRATTKRDPPRSSKHLTSEVTGLDERTGAPLVGEIDERAGETPVFTPESDGSSPYMSSTEPQGGQSRRSTSPAAREAPRAHREKLSGGWPPAGQHGKHPLAARCAQCALEPATEILEGIGLCAICARPHDAPATDESVSRLNSFETAQNRTVPHESEDPDEPF